MRGWTALPSASRWLQTRWRCSKFDQAGPQAWKKRRLAELGLPAPNFVPVDFETNDDWWTQLVASGFDTNRPAVVAASGVSMYLTRDAVVATLRRVAALAPGSAFAMTFLVPIEQMGAEVRPGFEMAAKGARANGTPFISFFTPQEMLHVAREAGFHAAQHVSADMLAARYFADRGDGLRPPANAEELLIATR
ncbi:MAG: class I SAM-dependent methyltransferase [Rhodocyclaceae bacterium]